MPLNDPAYPTTTSGLVSSIGTQLDTKLALKQDAAAGIAKAIVDVKGDLIVATAADTVGRLAPGTNNQVLTADSALAAGVKWATPSGSGGAVTVGTEWVNLKARGIAADGTDIATALETEMNAASSGAVMYFGTGDFGFARTPVIPSAKQLKFYGENSWAYSGVTQMLPSTYQTRLRCLTGFTGTALMKMPLNCRGMALRGLLLAGNNIGTNVHGVQLPPSATQVAESNLRMDNLAIAGFSGNGVTGRAWVTRMTDCLVAYNQNYGALFDDGATDSWFQGNSWAFNKNGAVRFTNAAHNGQIYFVTDRFERSGANPNAIATPFNQNAHGLEVERMQGMVVIGCSTDANTGDGLRFVKPATGSSPLFDVAVTGGLFSRDGGGQSSGTTAPIDRAGIRVTGLTGDYAQVSVTNVAVGTGTPGDSGETTLTCPQYAIKLSWVAFAKVSGVFRGNTDWATIDNLYRVQLDVPEQKVLTIPASAPIGTALVDGAIWMTGSGTGGLSYRYGGVTRTL